MGAGNGNELGWICKYFPNDNKLPYKCCREENYLVLADEGFVYEGTGPDFDASEYEKDKRRAQALARALMEANKQK